MPIFLKMFILFYNIVYFVLQNLQSSYNSVFHKPLVVKIGSGIHKLI